MIPYKEHLNFSLVNRAQEVERPLFCYFKGIAHSWLISVIDGVEIVLFILDSIESRDSTRLSW